MAKTIWILIANGAKAQLFKQTSDARRFQPKSCATFAGERAPSREVAADRPGRTFDIKGEGRHAKEPATDPLRHAKYAFARDLARHLDDADTRGRFDQLILVAGPQALGDLRATLPGRVRAKIAGEISKDLTSIPKTALAKHLDPVLGELTKPVGRA